MLGQAKATAPALAELDPQAGFQMRHLFAYGRLAGIERGLCRRKAAAPDDRGEYPEQFKVDIVQLDHRSLPAGCHIASADMNTRALFLSRKLTMSTWPLQCLVSPGLTTGRYFG
ncbi:hypothetical protein D3C71_1787120 [compost metagenome]